MPGRLGGAITLEKAAKSWMRGPFSMQKGKLFPMQLLVDFSVTVLGRDYLCHSSYWVSVLRASPGSSGGAIRLVLGPSGHSSLITFIPHHSNSISSLSSWNTSTWGVVFPMLSWLHSFKYIISIISMRSLAGRKMDNHLQLWTSPTS